MQEAIAGPDTGNDSMTSDRNATQRTFQTVLQESNQTFELRQPLYRRLAELREGRAVISFFASFADPNVHLVQPDADMVEEVLANSDCSKGVSLILNAPGGDGLAAERMIRVCRSYSGGDFETIVPARSKSAATIVCLGSDRILMSPTSELGPVDPQVPYDIGLGQPMLVPADTIVKTYDGLFEAAGNLEPNARIEPYLQQLSKFDAAYVLEMRKAQELSEDIALSSVKLKMLAGMDDDQIRERLRPFTDPDETKDHGRSIGWEMAQECGLEVHKIELNDDLWRVIWALYTRCNYVVNNAATPVGKLVESVNASYWSS